MEQRTGAGYNWHMNTIPALPKIFWSFFTLTLLAGAVNAQKLESDYDCVRGFGGRIERVHKLVAEFRAEQQDKAVAANRAAENRLRSEKEAGPGKIHDALVAMRDAVGVGEKVADYIERHPNISVEFDAIQGISSHDEIGGSVPLVTLRLNKELPRTARILAAAIANEAFEMMYDQMPETAEKAYMHASVVARAWLEIGNSAETLPVLDPDLPAYRNPELEAILRSWVFKDAGTAIREIGAAKKLPSLQDMLSKNDADVARLAQFDAEDRAYEHSTHHSDPSLADLVRQYRNAKETETQLNQALEILKQFRMGVDYKDAQGVIRNDHSGEDAWRQMNQGLHKF